MLPFINKVPCYNALWSYTEYMPLLGSCMLNTAVGLCSPSPAMSAGLTRTSEECPICSFKRNSSQSHLVTSKQKFLNQDFNPHTLHNTKHEWTPSKCTLFKSLLYTSTFCNSEATQHIITIWVTKSSSRTTLTAADRYSKASVCS